MTRQINTIWTNLAVGILGLIVGIDNLLRWVSDDSFTQGLVIGTLCTVLAASWLVYLLIKKSAD